MNSNANGYNGGNGKPIAVEVDRWLDLTTGQWRSCAYVKLTSALRHSGLLLALPSEELKSLFFLLSFLTPSGDCRPTLDQLAHAMNISVEKARARMDRLSQFLWQGKPLIRFVQRGNGLDAWTLAEGMTGSKYSNAQQPSNLQKPESAQQNSRADLPEPQHPKIRSGESSQETSTHRLKRRMLELGVEESRADSLIAQYDIERIQRQLDWLTHRHANNPARFIVAAIEKDYETPFALRNHTS